MDFQAAQSGSNDTAWTSSSSVAEPLPGTSGEVQQGMMQGVLLEPLNMQFPMLASGIFPDGNMINSAAVSPADIVGSTDVPMMDPFAGNFVSGMFPANLTAADGSFKMPSADMLREIAEAAVHEAQIKKTVSRPMINPKRRSGKTVIVTCGICRCIYQSFEELDEHIGQTHGFDYYKKLCKFRCPHCPQLLQTHDDLEEHLVKVHQTAYRCRLCSQRFKTEEVWKQHEKFAHVKDPYAQTVKVFPCPWCRIPFHSDVELQQHKQTKHRVTYMCSQCMQFFPTETDLKKHKVSAHGTSRSLPKNAVARHSFFYHPCNMCSNVYESHAELDVHCEGIHNKLSPPCDAPHKVVESQTGATGAQLVPVRNITRPNTMQQQNIKNKTRTVTMVAAKQKQTASERRTFARVTKEQNDGNRMIGSITMVNDQPPERTASKRIKLTKSHLHGQKKVVGLMYPVIKLRRCDDSVSEIANKKQSKSGNQSKLPDLVLSQKDGLKSQMRNSADFSAQRNAANNDTLTVVPSTDKQEKKSIKSSTDISINKCDRSLHFFCFSCSKLFMSVEDYQSHMKTSHKWDASERDTDGRQDGSSKTITCPVCPCMFVSRSERTSHLKNKHHTKVVVPAKVSEIDARTCKKCLEQLKTPDARLSHEAVCSEHFGAHLYNKGTVKIYTCNICLKVFTKKESVKAHIAMFHSTVEKRGNDTNKETNDTNKKSNDTNKESNDTNKESNDTNKKSNDTNKKSNDTNKESVDTNKESNDTNKKSNDTNKESNDTNKESNNMNKKSNNTNKESDDTNKESDDTNKESDDTNKESYDTNKESVDAYVGVLHSAVEEKGEIEEFKDIDEYSEFLWKKINIRKKPYECSSCHYYFPSIVGYRNHLSYYHHDFPMRLNCPICDRYFSTISLVIEHLQIEHNKQMHFCETCRCYHATQEDLTIHEQNVHQKYSFARLDSYIKGKQGDTEVLSLGLFKNQNVIVLNACDPQRKSLLAGHIPPRTNATDIMSVYRQIIASGSKTQLVFKYLMGISALDFFCGLHQFKKAQKVKNSGHGLSKLYLDDSGVSQSSKSVVDKRTDSTQNDTANKEKGEDRQKVEDIQKIAESAQNGAHATANGEGSTQNGKGSTQNGEGSTQNGEGSTQKGADITQEVSDSKQEVDTVAGKTSVEASVVIEEDTSKKQLPNITPEGRGILIKQGDLHLHLAEVYFESMAEEEFRRKYKSNILEKEEVIVIEEEDTQLCNPDVEIVDADFKSGQLEGRSSKVTQEMHLKSSSESSKIIPNSETLECQERVVEHVDSQFHVSAVDIETVVIDDSSAEVELSDTEAPPGGKCFHIKDISASTVPKIHTHVSKQSTDIVTIETGVTMETEDDLSHNSVILTCDGDALNQSSSTHTVPHVVSGNTQPECAGSADNFVLQDSATESRQQRKPDSERDWVESINKYSAEEYVTVVSSSEEDDDGSIGGAPDVEMTSLASNPEPESINPVNTDTSSMLHASYITASPGSLSVQKISDIDTPSWFIHEAANSGNLFLCDSCDFRDVNKQKVRNHMRKHYSSDESFDIVTLETGDGESDSQILTCCDEDRLNQSSSTRTRSRVISVNTQPKCTGSASSIVLQDSPPETDATIESIPTTSSCGYKQSDSQRCASVNNEILASTKNDVLNCPSCTYFTHIPEKYTAHQRAHLGKFICKDCNKAFPRALDLIWHWLTHKEAKSGNQFLCGSCDYRSKNKVNVLSHMKKHYSSDINKDETSNDIKKKGNKQYYGGEDDSSSDLTEKPSSQQETFGGLTVLMPGTSSLDSSEQAGLEPNEVSRVELIASGEPGRSQLEYSDQRVDGGQTCDSDVDVTDTTAGGATCHTPPGVHPVAVVINTAHSSMLQHTPLNNPAEHIINTAHNSTACPAVISSSADVNPNKRKADYEMITSTPKKICPNI